jgi:hypothetical protein
MENKKGHLTFIEVFSIIALSSSILSLIMSWGGIMPGIIGVVFAIITIKIGQITKYVIMSKISFIIAIIGLLISVTALILFGLSQTNVIPRYWGSFPYVW